MEIVKACTVNICAFLLFPTRALRINELKMLGTKNYTVSTLILMLSNIH